MKTLTTRETHFVAGGIAQVEGDLELNLGNDDIDPGFSGHLPLNRALEVIVISGALVIGWLLKKAFDKPQGVPLPAKMA